VFKVERALTGLFKAFKLQSQGNLPYLMQEQVQPTLDLNLWAFHAIGAQTTQTLAPTAIAGPGLLGSYTQTDDWLVLGVNAQSIAGGAVDWALLQVGWQSSALQPTFPIAGVNRWGNTGAMAAAAAGEVIGTFSQTFQQPFFSPAGAVWTYVCHAASVAVAPLADASVLHYRLNRS